MHLVAVLAFDGVVSFDLSTPCEVFGWARLADGRVAYKVIVCGAKKIVDAGSFDIRTRAGLRSVSRAQTVIVPGLTDPTRRISAHVVKALRSAARRGARIASICSGAFVLAAAGLLDGLRATTHWRAAGDLARMYPTVTVDPNVLYVDNGQILTSAGAAAGLDLCLHLIRRDYGASVAADAARTSVMPLERDGGQSQFIVHAPPDGDGGSLDQVLRWMEENHRKVLSLRAIARRAAMSTRTLSRRFREQTGTTPAQWVVRLRVHRAQQLLETTSLAIERISTEVGFGSTATFRERFQRQVGTSPQTYRRVFRSSAPTMRV
ncbi:MAG TPA: helix-turn-helix domain-containing protein [Polyangiaceae bacterium]|jgi:transcriptional regulator GlxA family with amidase domain|nr:helix-turn-helix domain-containing protein [Polyangiaceae bacterium]